MAELIAQATNHELCSVKSSQACSGGCIHRAEIVELDDGRRYFVKSSRDARNMFRTEAQGLSELAASGCMRVPDVVAQGTLSAGEDCLILEAINSGPRPHDFFETLGSCLARLHDTNRRDYCGWTTDNYLGSNLQRNTPNDSWLEFFAEQRLRAQLRMARNQGLGSPELFQLTERVISRLDQWIDDDGEHVSLLHGDLWSGNLLCDTQGQPVIFDPAVYYGHRETDLAMPLLFGGFSDAFVASYDEVLPLPSGWRQRVELYQLYHLLNHLNLFGSGYLDSCLEIVRKYG